MKWIEMSGINAKDYYPLLVLRLVTIICLVHLNCGKFSDLLSDLLQRSYIAVQLPWDFHDVLRRRLKHFHNVNVIAEAFKKINNPLVIVSLGKNCSQFLCPDVIFVDMTVKQCREDILRVLFPKTAKALQGQTGIIEVETTHSCSDEVLSSGSYVQEGCKLAPSNFVLNNMNGTMLPMDYSFFWEMFEALKSLENGRDPKNFLANAQIIKVDVDKCILLVNTVVNESLQNTLFLFSCMLDELKLLSAALGVSEPELGKDMSTIGELSKRLLSRRPMVEPILSQQFLQQGTSILVETSEATSTSVDQDNAENGSKDKTNSSADHKGKSKALEADFVWSQQ